MAFMAQDPRPTGPPTGLIWRLRKSQVCNKLAWCPAVPRRSARQPGTAAHDVTAVGRLPPPLAVSKMAPQATILQRKSPCATHFC